MNLLKKSLMILVIMVSLMFTSNISASNTISFNDAEYLISMFANSWEVNNDEAIEKLQEVIEILNSSDVSDEEMNELVWVMGPDGQLYSGRKLLELIEQCIDVYINEKDKIQTNDLIHC